MNSVIASAPAAFDAPPPTPLAAARASRVALLFLGLALVLGALVRADSVLRLPFAFGDGGMFWVATRAILDAGFALPARLPYPAPTAELPFCYPPLGFYVAAALAQLGVPLALVFRWLPWAWSVSTIWAFWRLARAFWGREPEGEWAAGAATLGWALLPWSFVWMTMGGGLARALGLLWAFLAVEAALRLWRDGQSQKWWPLLLFLALALATHLERARFAVVAVALIWLFYGRTARGAWQLASALMGAALVTAPWWGLCLARFGPGPFLQGAHSGGNGWQGEAGVRALAKVATFTLSGEAILPAFHVVGLCGVVWCLWRRQWFLPAWFALILLLEVRSGRSFVIAPLALCAGLLLANAPRLRVAAMSVLACWLCLLSVLVQVELRGLSAHDLEAINWAKRNAPAGARFLVIPMRSWDLDVHGEWFPALAERAAVLTVQGAEWLPGDEFSARRQRHAALYERRRSWRAIEEWTKRNAVSYDWVWLPEGASPLEPGAGWTKQWSRGQSAIWRRTEPSNMPSNAPSNSSSGQPLN